MLALFSDKALDPAHPLAYLVPDSDFGGWWGDGIDVRSDLGEQALGSWLWVLARAPLSAKDRHVGAELRARCLGAPAGTGRGGADRRLDGDRRAAAQLTVAMYGRDGGKVYDRRFDLLWSQVQASLA